MKLIHNFFTIISVLLVLYIVIALNFPIIQYESYGLWSSLYDTGDKIMGLINGCLLIFLSHIIDRLIFAKCFNCMVVKPVMSMESIIVGGSGPETCESSYICKNCKK